MLSLHRNTTECGGIRNKIANFSDLRYEMIFGNLKDQEKFTKVYHLMIQARDDLLKDSSPPSNGT